jgi:hypothetical protein
MTDVPTTENGPLHTPDATFNDRLIQATFKTPDEARATRDRLVQSGISPDRVRVIYDAAESGDVNDTLRPEDQTLFGRLREKILPDDSNTATSRAAAQHEAVLEVHPTQEEVEKAVQIIEGSNPSRFDPRLERWRNAAS